MMLVYIGYNIFDGLTIFLDHLLDTDGWLYFTLTVSFLWDTTALFIIPNIILLNSKYKNDSFWTDKDYNPYPNPNKMKRKRTLDWSITNPNHIRYRTATLEDIVCSKNKSSNNRQSIFIVNRFKLSRRNSLLDILKRKDTRI